MLNIYNSLMIGNVMNLLLVTNLLRKFQQVRRFKRRCINQKSYHAHSGKSRKTKYGTGNLRS
jgi:hypothetical protein